MEKLDRRDFVPPAGEPSQHPWEETQVSPGKSSQFQCKEFLPIGSGSKCDVSSHGFLTRAVPLRPKNAISPAFPFSVLLTHHTSPAYTHMHIWSPSVGREGDVLRSHLTQHFTEVNVKKSRNHGHTGQTHLSNLVHTHSSCPQGWSVPLEGLVAHCSSHSPQENDTGCCWRRA